MVYQKPYTFRAGTYAKSAEVNANFDTVKNFVDELEDRISEGLASSPAYNKANINGSATEIFKALKDTSNTNSNSVVINSQLDTVNTSLGTRITALENADYLEAPDYTNVTSVSANSVIPQDGWLYVNTLQDAYGTVKLNNRSIYLYRGIMLPVKSGTQVGETTNVFQMVLFT